MPGATSDIRGVLFDMDGVVIDSEPVSARIMQDAARSFGFDVPDAAMDSFKGLPGDVVYARVASEFGAGRVTGPELRAVRDRLYEDVLAGIPLMPSVQILLRHIAYRNWAMALVTSSRRRHAETVVAVHGLRDFFPVVLGSEDVARPKPAPDPYLEAASHLGLESRSCLAVEDSPNGVRSASAAGCIVVGFGNGFPAHVLRSCGARILASDHVHLADLLCGGDATPGAT